MRALVSVYDKTGLEAFARGLVALGFELVSSGGTSRALAGAGVPHLEVGDVTGFPEMLGGRVKTLHPRIHAGVLADRAQPRHLADLAELGIVPIDLVVCNLYPFPARPSVEMIDVGGPTMVRAAAKNHEHVGVVVDPADYGDVLGELRREGALSDGTRRRLARAAFAHTAAYDAAIVAWMDEGSDDEVLPPTLHLALERTDERLRYGENPHQRAARYRQVGGATWWDGVEQLAGLALSYLNIYDAEAAWRLVHDLGPGPACAIVKHANPCGVATADGPAAAYRRALEGDERSAFGGIVAVNRPVTAEVADAMVAGPQADVVVAPGFDAGAVDRLVARRKATRLLRAAPPEAPRRHYRQVGGGFLVQEPHSFRAGRDQWRVVTRVEPTEEQWRDAELAWRIGGHVKSNSIVLVRGAMAVGIGAGQQSRVDAAELAARKAAGRARGGACASDAFYPFRDGVDAAAGAGVAVVVQPGGSLRDDEVVAAADEHGLAMVLTGERHFLH
ncbi:MAG: bifunctional phosphoribosylaminoimidazolecarboxamide formyltransferase/IMP cyclohydrolase [Acidimicrobiia bacterium]